MLSPNQKQIKFETKPSLLQILSFNENKNTEKLWLLTS